MQQHHATILALGAGLEVECQDLDAMGLKPHFSNVEIPLKIACNMQECCVVRYARKGHATKPIISYITAGSDSSTCSVLQLPGDITPSSTPVRPQQTFGPSTPMVEKITTPNPERRADHMVESCPSLVALGGGLGGLCAILAILLVGVVMGWVWSCHRGTGKQR